MKKVLSKLSLRQRNPFLARTILVQRSVRAVLFSITLLFLSLSCSHFVGRPIQEFSDQNAAIRAAKETGAQTAAPELFRRAEEYALRATNEYRAKNFLVAREYAIKAKEYAEKAEWLALLKGQQRESLIPQIDEIAPPPPKDEYESDTVRGRPGYRLESEAAAGSSGNSGSP